MQFDNYIKKTFFSKFRSRYAWSVSRHLTARLSDHLDKWIDIIFITPGKSMTKVGELHENARIFCFCLFDLILYVHSTIFQLCGTVFLGWTSTKLG